VAAVALPSGPEATWPEAGGPDQHPAAVVSMFSAGGGGAGGGSGAGGGGQDPSEVPRAGGGGAGGGGSCSSAKTASCDPPKLLGILFFFFCLVAPPKGAALPTLAGVLPDKLFRLAVGPLTVTSEEPGRVGDIMATCGGRLLSSGTAAGAGLGSGGGGGGGACDAGIDGGLGGGGLPVELSGNTPRDRSPAETAPAVPLSVASLPAVSPSLASTSAAVKPPGNATSRP